MPFYDFYFSFAAAQLILRGENPYDLNLLTAEMHSLGWPVTESANAFFYFPWTLYLFVPVALVPFWVAAILWSGLSAYVFWEVTRFMRSQAECSGVFSLTMLSLLAILFFPVFKHLFFGNSTYILLGTLVVCAITYSRGRYVIAGMCLSVLAMKPQLLLLVIVAYLVHALRESRVSLFWGVAAGFILQIIVSVLMAPSAFLYFWESGDSWGRGVSAQTASLVHVLVPLGHREAGSILVLVAAGITGIFLGLKSELRIRDVLLLLVPVSLVFAPYSWSHDFVLLLPAHVFLCMAIGARFGRKSVYYISLPLFALSFLLVSQPPNEQFLFFYPWLYLAGILYMGHGLSTPARAIRYAPS